MKNQHALYIAPGTDSPRPALFVLLAATGLATIAITDPSSGTTTEIEDVPRGSLAAAPCIAEASEAIPGVGFMFTDTTGDAFEPVLLDSRDQTTGEWTGHKIDGTPFSAVASPSPSGVDPVKGCWLPSPSKL